MRQVNEKQNLFPIERWQKGKRISLILFVLTLYWLLVVGCCVRYSQVWKCHEYTNTHTHTIQLHTKCVLNYILLKRHKKRENMHCEHNLIFTYKLHLDQAIYCFSVHCTFRRPCIHPSLSLSVFLLSSCNLFNSNHLSVVIPHCSKLTVIDWLKAAANASSYIWIFHFFFDCNWFLKALTTSSTLEFQ